MKPNIRTSIKRISIPLILTLSLSACDSDEEVDDNAGSVAGETTDDEAGTLINAGEPAGEPAGGPEGVAGGSGGAGT